MLKLEIPEAGIRKEVYEFADEFEDLGKLFFDGVPNSQQWNDFFAETVGAGKEGSDLFTKVPKAERTKAIGHALMIAGAKIYDEAVEYSDEVEASPDDEEEPSE